MTTIKDVARLAGVSTSTVSHVINKTRFVAENTTKKVYSAIEELHYSPSFVARSLKCNSTKTIGVLVTKSSSLYFAEVIQGIENYCFNKGYNMILCNTFGELNRQEEYLKNLSEKRVDGVLMICSELTEKLSNTLENKINFPLIVMNWSGELANTDNIQDNSIIGGYIATKHLIDNGHKKISCITGPLNKLTCQHRLIGFRQALQQANIEENPDWIIEADFECLSAVSATKKILAMPEKPTAIFCFNDNMALATISTLQLANIDVPNDISVIGYDNIDIAAFYSPPLTSIHIPKYHLGEKAAKLLLDRINGKVAQKQTIEFNPELISRQSVKSI